MSRCRCDSHSRLLVVFVLAFLIPPAAAFVVAPGNPQAGSQVQFSVNDPTGYNFVWNFGDGFSATGNPASHTYASPGTYLVSLSYTGGGPDPVPVSSAQSVVVRAVEAPATTTIPVPVVVAGFTVSPVSPKAASPVTFDAGATTDPSGVINSWSWDFGDGSGGEGKTVAHTYGYGGDFTVTLRVYHKDPIEQSARYYGTASRSVRIAPGSAPVAAFTFSPQAPSAMETVSFDASASSDPDGYITAYRWDFGDGSTGYGMTATHAFPDSGPKTITLTVTDNEQKTGSRSAQVAVLPVTRPSVMIWAYPKNPRPGEVAAFEATDLVDPKGLIDRYHWDFGDGTSGLGRSVSHSFLGDGTYVVTLQISSTKVQDPAVAGSYTGQASLLFFVIADPLPLPAFSVSPNPPVENEDVWFDAVSSAGPGGEIRSYRWDFGDGSSGSGRAAVHRFAAAGSYPVTLTVTDTRGRTATARNEIPVRARSEIPPWAFLPVPGLIGGYLGYRGYRVIRARRNCPRVRVTLDWNGGVETEEKPPGWINTDIQFSGGIEDKGRR